MVSGSLWPLMGPLRAVVGGGAVCAPRSTVGSCRRCRSECCSTSQPPSASPFASPRSPSMTSPQPTRCCSPPRFASCTSPSRLGAPLASRRRRPPPSSQRSHPDWRSERFLGGAPGDRDLAGTALRSISRAAAPDRAPSAKGGAGCRKVVDRLAQDAHQLGLLRLVEVAHEGAVQERVELDALHHRAAAG